MDIALAQIGAGFDQAAVINGLKLRVERSLRLAPDHPAIRARFAARAAMLSGRGLQEAVTVVEQWWRAERKAFQIASALGRGSRLSLEVLSELRLILRHARLTRRRAGYAAALAALRGSEAPTMQAAE